MYNDSIKGREKEKAEIERFQLLVTPERSYIFNLFALESNT